jgi:hypothetical protein
MRYAKLRNLSNLLGVVVVVVVVVDVDVSSLPSFDCCRFCAT